jgi:uncharacterized metal-binding protein
MTAVETPTCSECRQTNCYRHDRLWPDFCPTTALGDDERSGLVETYAGDESDALMARAAAEIEGKWYARIGRVEETIAFARRIGVTRIGVATCLGLIEETRILVGVLRAAGFEAVTALCKVGSIEKTEIGLEENQKVRPGGYEAACNPILQARLLNRAETGLNLIMGLCVGHDIVFTRHSEAPVTTLVVKDRLYGHNPAAALYTIRSYSRRLLDETHLAEL